MSLVTAEIETLGMDYVDAADSGCEINDVKLDESSDEQSMHDEQCDWLQEYFLIPQIYRYFRANPLEQKQIRRNLAEAIRNTNYIEPCFETILSNVGEKASQNAMLAAIDLLSSVG